MQARLLLGPAGSGKTFRCLSEIRRVLLENPDGPPLLLVAPKQTTYQLERQLLGDSSLLGYTRLKILSFERLAEFIFDQLRQPPPRLLNEEGRLMVLRALLARKRDELKLFRASARLAGFARQLNDVLHELQRQQLTPDKLRTLAGKAGGVGSLACKLHDFATLLEDYLNWLKAHQLQDADCLLDAATTEALRASSGRKAEDQGLKAVESEINIAGLWVDGFAEIPPQELDLLVALLPGCEQATFTFCLDRVPQAGISWLSNWSLGRKTYEDCRTRLSRLPNCDLEVELLPRHPDKTRFLNNPVLLHLETGWSEPTAPGQTAFPPCPTNPARKKTGGGRDATPKKLEDSLRVVVCANREAEATLAAREIMRYVRGGGRYREVTVLVRKLEDYHKALQRVFGRYQIPCFLDRRESVAHHPLAELTRNALRTVTFQWQRDDWFAALKTGLVPVEDTDIDRLENEALARGWKASTWQQSIQMPDAPELERWAESLRQKMVPPFQKLALKLAAHADKPTGPQLAEALRRFWGRLNVEKQLQDWAAAEIPSSASGPAVAGSVHATVWEEMQTWLENVALAFSSEALTLKEWLPVLEAGLSSFTIGVIPPALDQVFIGSIDRSRNPDIKLALVLGLNETIFPAPPESGVLLSDADRAELERQNVPLSAGARQQLSRERFYGYVAFTRARQRLVLTCSTADDRGQTLNPSPFLPQIQRLFPTLKTEPAPRPLDLLESEHVNELIGPLLGSQIQSPAGLDLLPMLAEARARLQPFAAPGREESLSPELAGRLYGPKLHTSVSRMEQFAACPFKFFVHSGLRAEERELFELDIREQGTFQHDVLKFFHLELQQEQKQWRDISPEDARERTGRIAKAMIASYHAGLLEASAEGRFTARVLTESLQDFVETLVRWMREQYEFDPVAVEVPFGGDEASPAWEIDLGDGHQLALHGRIDRVDVCHEADPDEAQCVVIDYKSSQKQLDSVLMKQGVQLQLPAYLAVLRHWSDPKPIFGVSRLIPVGVFYVNLRGRNQAAAKRNEALENAERGRKLAYRHSGRFDVSALRRLDRRPEATRGDQFNYRLTQGGKLYQNSPEAMEPGEFAGMLTAVETRLREMGRAVFSGVAKVDPYQRGAREIACEQCSYQAVCRIDPWTHRFRPL